MKHTHVEVNVAYIDGLSVTNRMDCYTPFYDSDLSTTVLVDL